MKVLFASFLAVLFSATGFVQEVAKQEQMRQLRSWMLPDFVVLEASLESFDTGQVILRDAKNDLHYIPFRELTRDDQLEVMKATGWGRVWQDSSGKHTFVGDLVSVGETSVMLENVDGERILVDIHRLSGIDKSYVELRRTVTDEVIPDTFSAQVVGVHDGDTLTVLINQRQFKIRMDGIDAPERGQAFGSKSKNRLSELVMGKTITGTRIGNDRYGRNLCQFEIGGVNVNAKMVEEGLAWHFEKYSDDKNLAALQVSAQTDKRNLWSESGPIPPWDWRRMSSAQRKNWFLDQGYRGDPTEEETKPAFAVGEDKERKQAANPPPKTTKPEESKPPVEVMPPSTLELSHWLNTDSGVRHNRGCRWYKNTKQGRPCGANEGKACNQCGGIP